MLRLTALQPFAKGGNRLCFVHPESRNLCIKVRRPDFTLADLRRKKGFPKTLRPLSSFDDNLEEYRVLEDFNKKYGIQAFEVISKCYGFEDTDLGKGLVSELVRDSDGAISLNIKQYILEEGVTESFKKEFEVFCIYWQKMAMPSRSLLIHNVVVQQGVNGKVERLVVIDGLGYAGVIPQFLLSKGFFQKKSARKILDLKQRMQEFIDECDQGKKPTHVGLMYDRDRP